MHESVRVHFYAHVLAFATLGLDHHGEAQLQRVQPNRLLPEVSDAPQCCQCRKPTISGKSKEEMAAKLSSSFAPPSERIEHPKSWTLSTVDWPVVVLESRRARLRKSSTSRMTSESGR